MPFERNLIQAPELIARITSLLGMKQRSVAPTLNETLQPVIIAGDVTTLPEVQPAGVLCRVQSVIGGPIIDYDLGLYNPATSNTMARVTYIELQAIQAIHEGVIGISTTAYHDVAYPFQNNVGVTVFRDLRRTDPGLELPRLTPRFFGTATPITIPQRTIRNTYLNVFNGGDQVLESDAHVTERREIWVPPGWVLHFQNAQPLLPGDGIRGFFAWTEEPVKR